MLSPKERREKLENDVNRLLSDYEKETGLEVTKLTFNRRPTAHRYVPTVSLIAVVP